MLVVLLKGRASGLTGSLLAWKSPTKGDGAYPASGPARSQWSAARTLVPMLLL